MLYKKCSTCHKKLSRSSFYKTTQNKDGLFGNCKPCHRKYYKKYYEKNQKRISKQISIIRARNRRIRMLFLLKYLKEHHCIDCGESDPRCLDFDHVRGKKKHDVSRMIDNCRNEKVILKEIKKCEVRCSNCHRLKTAKEMDYYNYIDFDTMTIIENKMPKLIMRRKYRTINKKIADQIREDYKILKSSSKVASKYKVSGQRVLNIVNNKCWI